mmetsp:Transcript_86840/g.166094  ORF Transcript_86840/g.166094 Transcript_86840/m.166094 type:complete len:80 (+) Transcript_86840:1089-1328(+)
MPTQGCGQCPATLVTVTVMKDVSPIHSVCRVEGEAEAEVQDVVRRHRLAIDEDAWHGALALADQRAEGEDGERRAQCDE